MKKSNYILGYCPRCSGVTYIASKDEVEKKGVQHPRYLFKCKLFGSIPAWKCGKCGYVFRAKEN